MQKLLITGFRGIGDGERIAYDERAILLGNAVAAVDVADRGLFLRGWVNRLLRIGNDGLRKLIKDGVRRRRRVVTFQRQMGQGIGAADDFLKVGLDPLRLVEQLASDVLRLILVRRDVDNIVLRFFRFCRSFRHNCLFLNGRSGFFLLHRLFAQPAALRMSMAARVAAKSFFIYKPPVCLRF